MQNAGYEWAYGSVKNLLDHYCHIYPKELTEDGRLIVDYELMFTGQTALQTAEYRLPEHYEGVGRLVSKEVLYRGNVWILHFNQDGTIFCTKRPEYTNQAEMEQIGGPLAVNTGGMNYGPLVVEGKNAWFGKYRVDPDSLIGVCEGGMPCARKGSLLLREDYPTRTSPYRYELHTPPYDPAYEDNRFLPGLPYDVEIRKAWRYIRLGELPDGVYPRARLHKIVSELVDGEPVIKAGFMYINDPEGRYQIKDDHLIIRSVSGQTAEAEFYGGEVRTIQCASVPEANALYRYSADETTGIYTLLPERLLMRTPETVHTMMSEDRFYLERHGDLEYMTTRCAVVVENHGEKHFGRIAAKGRGDTRTAIRVWGSPAEDGYYPFAYVKYEYGGETE